MSQSYFAGLPVVASPSSMPETQTSFADLQGGDVKPFGDEDVQGAYLDQKNR